MKHASLLQRLSLILVLLSVFLGACGSVDLDAPVPVFETGVDPESWATVPAGEFLSGQHESPTLLD